MREEKDLEMAERTEKQDKKTLIEMVRVLGEIEQLLLKHNMHLSFENGVYFDTDDWRRLRMRLTIAQTP